MEKGKSFFNPIASFFDAYGWGFIMLVGSGLIIAILIEIIIKNSAKWLNEKWKSHERLLRAIEGARIVLTQIVAWALSVWFSQLVCKVAALPGGDVLLPIWVSLIYGCQYIFSCFGIKGIIAWAKKRGERAEQRAMAKAEAKAEREKVKDELTLLPGSDSVYTDGQGHYFTKDGKRL